MEEFSQFEIKIKKNIEEHLNVYLAEAKKLNIKNFNIGSMMMIPKNKQVSKIFQKKSAILHKDRSNIIRKENNSEDKFGENYPSSNGLNDKA